MTMISSFLHNGQLSLSNYGIRIYILNIGEGIWKVNERVIGVFAGLRREHNMRVPATTVL